MSKGPFWIGYRPFKSYIAKLQALSSHLENPVKEDDFHITLFYSKDNKKEWPRTILNMTQVKPTGYALLGEALVLLVEPSKMLMSRFEDVKANYPTDFPQWIPHITIGYRSNVEELKSLQHVDPVSMFDGIIPMYGEFIENVGNPDEGAKDKASYMDQASLDAVFDSDTAKRSKAERMMGRSGMLKYFNTRISQSESLVKAWDGQNFDAFKTAFINLGKNLKKDWEAKNEELAKEKGKK